MELLWTDQCFLGMLLVGVLLLVQSLRRWRTRQAYKNLLSQPRAVSSGIILLFFLVIALLDSVHFNVTGEEKAGVNKMPSLLDKILSPLDQIDEKTYSMPLALTLYTKETSVVDGVIKQVYPRLHYPPLTIKTKKERNKQIAAVLIRAFFYSGLCIFLLESVLLIMRRAIIFNKAKASALITLFCCLFFLLSSFWLSRYFHLFGTGKIGQDIFYLTVKSIRTGLIIGTLTTVFMLPLAIILGIMAGYFGGFIDDIIQFIYTTLSSIPGVLLITASVLSMQTYIANHPLEFSTLEKSADARLLALCFILGVTSWTSLCRLLRAEALKFREIDFVIAAKALGGSHVRVIYKHLLPNVLSLVLITLILDFSFLVLAEAVLAYVGVGVSPLTLSWGNMINGARLELARDPIVWWPMAAAFIFMFILVLASNLFADTVRDVFDPRNE